MKVLSYNAFFQLPDDFSGSLSDALRLVADYHESDKVISKRETSFPKKRKVHDLYKEFCKILEEDKKHVCEYNLMELKKNKWVRLKELG